MSFFKKYITCNGYPLMATIQSDTANRPSRSIRPPGSMPWTISRPSVSQGTTCTPKGPISLGITISNNTSPPSLLPSMASIAAGGGLSLEGLLKKKVNKEKWYYLNMTQNYKYELLWPRSIKLLDNTQNDLKSAKKCAKLG